MLPPGTHNKRPESEQYDGISVRVPAAAEDPIFPQPGSPVKPLRRTPGSRVGPSVFLT